MHEQPYLGHYGYIYGPYLGHERQNGYCLLPKHNAFLFRIAEESEVTPRRTCQKGE
jgi:hypothetical protein